MTDKKILIVEDDKFLADLLADYFEKEKLNFELALNAEMALEKIKKEKPDLIILDIILPGMNGYEFLEQIKNDSGLKEIPVIILSNLGQKEEIKRGLELGAEDFLVKANFDLGEIVQKVKQFLQI